MDGLLSALEQYFYTQGLTFNRVEVTTLIAAAVEGTSSGGAIFSIDNTDPVFYMQTGTDAVITHPLLMGKEGYPVSTTQSNTFWRPGEIICNKADGKLTIPNFSLANGEVIIIFAIGAKAPDDITGIVARLTRLEKAMKPITDGDVIIPWLEQDLTKSPPVPWVEVFDLAGRVPIGLYTSKALMSVVGQIGGTDVLTDIPAHHHSNPSFKVTVTPGLSEIIGLSQEAGTTPGQTGTTGTTDPISILNPYFIVRWIKLDPTKVI